MLINRNLRDQEERLRYDLAYFIGHRLLHNGDGLVSAHEASWSSDAELQATAAGTAGMGAQDVLYAWRDFECSFFAGALLCARVPFRRFLVREAHRLSAGRKLGVTTAVVMRRMTAVSPYRYWHYFDASSGVSARVPRQRHPAAVGNMSLVSDPCPRWAVFRLLEQPLQPKHASHQPMSQISVMQDGKRARLYCCHSILTRDAARAGTSSRWASISCRHLTRRATMARTLSLRCPKPAGAAGRRADPPRRARLESVSQVLNIHWIHDALARPLASSVRAVGPARECRAAAARPALSFKALSRPIRPLIEGATRRHSAGRPPRARVAERSRPCENANAYHLHLRQLRRSRPGSTASMRRRHGHARMQQRLSRRHERSLYLTGTLLMVSGVAG